MLKELNFSRFELVVNVLNDEKSIFINFGYKVIKSEFDYSQNIKPSLLASQNNPKLEVIFQEKQLDKIPLNNALRKNHNSINLIFF